MRVILAVAMTRRCSRQIMKLVRREPVAVEDDLSGDKNFGAFPPELPDNMFDDVNFV